MSKRDEFFDILSSVKIDNIEDRSNLESSLQPIAEWIKNNTPNRLFRFLSTNNRNVIALKNDEIWGSLSTTFNDPYECLPSFDLDKIYKEFESALEIDNLKLYFEAIRQGLRIPQMQMIPPEVLGNIISLINSDSFDLSLEKAFAIFQNNMKTWWKHTITQTIHSFYTLFQSEQKHEYITCFSEQLNATLLWAHYSESHKGFCLEYDWEKDLKDTQHSSMKNKVVLLAPVKYSATRFDASSYIYTIMEKHMSEQMKIDFTPYFRDMLAFMKILLVKSLDWSYEQEWRMFSYDVETDQKHKIVCKQRPTAIYIGAKTPPELERELYEISLEKNIPCYKMMQSYIDNRFVVEPKLYDEYKDSVLLAQHFNAEYGQVY